MNELLAILSMLLPWPVRRRFLRLCGYRLHKNSRIGLSLVSARHVELGDGASIGHFNVIRGLDHLIVGDGASVGNMNWVCAIRRPFVSVSERLSAGLFVDDGAAITHQHLIDCSDRVTIGRFATFAGWRSQILTHSIDTAKGRQTTGPVRIGAYSFVGTGSIILKDSVLPDFCVLGAGSVLNRPMERAGSLYAGSPAKYRKSLDMSSAYFLRTDPRVQL